VTLTFTTPLPAGLVAVQLLVLAQLTPVAAVAPKRTLVAPAVVLKPLPASVTSVPPVLGPLAGLTLVTVGAAGGGLVV
jgi:hypothetical protein